MAKNTVQTTPTQLAAMKAADIRAAIKAKTITTAQAVGELTRRIEKRAAAGRYPMEHIVALRDELQGA